VSRAGDVVLAKATRLVQHCEHTQRLLRSVLDCADAPEAFYDPVSDRHFVTLPGGLVRAIRQTLEPSEPDPS
jgi:hypothetical protein